jgi:CHAT domain-containing protein
VTQESDAIKNACAESYNCGVLKQPDVQLVLQSIVDSDIMHFACQGSSDIKVPTQSHLMLQRTSEHGAEIDKLSVSKILGVIGSRFAWISFLSACSTAEIRGSELADEGLHISSALQLAGFVHVIGSIWPVDDEVSVYVASSFYKNLINKSGPGLGNREVAEALRQSILDVRKRYSEPWKWAAYIHSGA